MIGRRDRILAVGRTGSGKTTLLRTLVHRLPYYCILDTKQVKEDGWRGKVVHNLKGVEKNWSKGPLVYQPEASEMTVRRMDTFFKWWYETTQDVPLVIDEAATRGILHSMQWSQYADLLLRQGRGRKQPVWCGSQRPAYLKNEVISETDHAFQFELKLAVDRKKMAGLSDDPRLLTNPPVLHSAWYIDANGKVRYMPPIKRTKGEIVVKK